MLSQFLPLLLAIVFDPSKSKLMIFFAIATNTLYTIDDFQSGFYEATLDIQSGIIPRMRVSAVLLGLQNDYKLPGLDRHELFFHEFILVHLLSQVGDMNYIIAYILVIRQLSILLWSIVFTLAYTHLKNKGNLIVILLAASSFMANYGYNYETSFSSLTLLMLYIFTIKVGTKREDAITAYLLLLVITSSSQPDTIVIGFLSSIVIILNFIMGIHSGVFKGFTIISLFITFIRGYISAYFKQGLRLFDIFPEMVRTILSDVMSKGSVTLVKPPLETLGQISSPIDRWIGRMSAISILGLWSILAILALLPLLRKGFSRPVYLAVSISYLFSFLIMIISYASLKVLGKGPVGDFGSCSIFARSIGPLLVLTSSHLSIKGVGKTRNKSILKNLYMFAIIFLSFTMIFAPFTWIRGDIKSVYDVIRIPHANIIESNSAYRFVTSYLPSGATIDIPYYYFIRRQYGLLLDYNKFECPTGARLYEIDQLIDHARWKAGFASSYTSGTYLIEYAGGLYRWWLVRHVREP